MQTEKKDLQKQKSSDVVVIKSQGNKTNILTSLILLSVIVFVFLGSQQFKNSIKQSKELLTRIQVPSQEPIKVNKEKKNVMCPRAKSDLESCKQKLQKCKKTQAQFNKASKQFDQLIQDCAVSNEQHQKANEDMQAEIIKMQETLKQYQKNK